MQAEVGTPAKSITAGLIVTLALQSAVPPFATDMYAPSFPQVAVGLNTSSAMVGFTLTSFFIGMGLGQVLGGSLSDRLGRRRPMLAGGLICTLGALGCALTGSIGLLIVARFFQGLGGGTAVAVARAQVVDLAEGDRLAKVMTLLGAIGGFAPMIAPVIGGVIASFATWRLVFWCLTGFGVLMTVSAWAVVPESLPPQCRQSGGLARLVRDFGTVLRLKPFLAYLALNCFSGAAMFAYIADSSYVLQGLVGLTPLVFSLVFAGNAFISVLLSFINSGLVGRVRPRTLIRLGLTMNAGAVALLTVTVFGWSMALVPTVIGFAVLLGGQAFIFGNSSALALSYARRTAGTASAVMGLIGSLVNSAVAPIASSGGETTAHPMIVVMLVGAVGAWLAFYWTSRLGRPVAGESS